MGSGEWVLGGRLVWPLVPWSRRPPALTSHIASGAPFWRLSRNPSRGGGGAASAEGGARLSWGGSHPSAFMSASYRPPSWWPRALPCTSQRGQDTRPPWKAVAGLWPLGTRPARRQDAWNAWGGRASEKHPLTRPSPSSGARTSDLRHPVLPPLAQTTHALQLAPSLRTFPQNNEPHAPRGVATLQVANPL